MPCHYRKRNLREKVNVHSLWAEIKLIKFENRSYRDAAESFRLGVATISRYIKKFCEEFPTDYFPNNQFDFAAITDEAAISFLLTACTLGNKPVSIFNVFLHFFHNSLH